MLAAAYGPNVQEICRRKTLTGLFSSLCPPFCPVIYVTGVVCPGLSKTFISSPLCFFNGVKCRLVRRSGGGRLHPAIQERVVCVSNVHMKTQKHELWGNHIRHNWTRVKNVTGLFFLRYFILIITKETSQHRKKRFPKHFSRCYSTCFFWLELGSTQQTGSKGIFWNLFRCSCLLSGWARPC